MVGWMGWIWLCKWVRVRARGCIQAQIRFLFHFPIFFYSCTFFGHFGSFLCHFLLWFAWFRNYLFFVCIQQWECALRKEKISYILHKFHLVCNAHAHTYVFLSVTVSVIHKNVHTTMGAACIELHYIPRWKKCIVVNKITDWFIVYSKPYMINELYIAWKIYHWTYAYQRWEAHSRKISCECCTILVEIGEIICLQIWTILDAVL